LKRQIKKEKKMPTDITDVMMAINQSGGLKITMDAAQNWDQFWITVIIAIIGSLFVVVLALSMIKADLSVVIAKIVLRKYKAITGRRALIIKHTVNELFNTSMITESTIRKVRKAMKDFKGEPFDLILHTPGGSVFASQLISSIIHTYPSQVRAVVPMYSMSGGTLLALSCDEILLSDTACLGPVDPQLGYLWRAGSARSWQEVINTKGKKASDESIQMAFEGNKYTGTIKDLIDNLLTDKIINPIVRMQTVDKLTDGGMEHGRPLMIADLAEMSIPVKRTAEDYPEEATELIEKILFSSFYEGVYWV
jgi:ClpP class serine protease